VGRARSTVANTLRLLDLAPTVQQALEASTITEGHARAIGGLETFAAQEEALKTVVRRRLSVRQAEEMVRRARDNRSGTRTRRASSPDVERLEQGLREALATKVTLNTARKGGKITIEYYDEDDLERIYERLTGSRP
jgi:ParB family chromosome partitioning protein